MGVALRVQYVHVSTCTRLLNMLRFLHVAFQPATPSIDVLLYANGCWTDIYARAASACVSGAVHGTNCRSALCSPPSLRCSANRKQLDVKNPRRACLHAVANPVVVAEACIEAHLSLQRLPCTSDVCNPTYNVHGELNHCFVECRVERYSRSPSVQHWSISMLRSRRVAGNTT